MNSPLGKEVRHSVCALDCPDACSLLVTVEDGKATKLRGNPDHPVTRGFLCGKVARYLEREYSPERLLYPQRRVGGKGEGRFERIGWDEALGEIAARLGGIAREFGPEAVLPYSYGGTLGVLNGAGMDRRFLSPFGGEPAGQDDLLSRRHGGAQSDIREQVWRRTRAVCEGEVDYRLGRERTRDQCPPVAVYRRGSGGMARGSM